jgi:hypothetical protein
MTTYTIPAKEDGTGFDVAVIGDDGVHHTVLGFATRADAEAWIAEDSKLPESAEPEEEWRS